MSRLFNTAHDRITADEMTAFAKVLIKDKREPTAAEKMAAVSAIRAFRNGAPMARVRQVFADELARVII